MPAPVAAELQQFKLALVNAADAVFACRPTADATEIEKTLASALHANRSEASVSMETVNGQDVGAYGSDLAVQVLPMSSSPAIVEVDFRFGIECGDDNVLLVYEQTGPGSSPWKQRLRWGMAPYNDVSRAVGDFVMLTPLTGSYATPRWRFLVAHGQPGCGASPRPSSFALDLLSPTGDAAEPQVDWHFDHAYVAGAVEPRLQTTEDSIDFRLASAAATTAGQERPKAEVYRFHLGQNGAVEPGPSTTPTPGRGTQAAAEPPGSLSPR